jgi:thioredoxin-related protein
MYLKYFILTVVLLFGLTTFAQDFNEIKDKEIELVGYSEEDLEVINKNIYTFLGDDFDSLDLDFFTHPRTLSAMLIGLVTSEEQPTYGLLYDQFLEMKRMPHYPKLKRKYGIGIKLMQRTADFANWEEDKALIMELELEPDVFDSLRAYIKEHSSTSEKYETVLVGFSEQQEKQKLAARKKEIGELDNLLAVSSLFNETELLAQSKLENKPIMLYFTGYACVNCRRIEHSTLLDPDIATLLMNEFIFVPLFVDDNSELALEDQKKVYVGERAMDLRSIGDKHHHYQVSRFQTSSQPYFVVLNGENEILEIADYSTSSIEDYLLFLQNSLDAFYKK